LGSANTALSNTYTINIANPASFATPIFQLADVGLSGSIKNIKSPGGNFNTSGASIRNFNFLFPISKRIGLGFGLMPYTANKFELSDETIPETSALVKNTINGQGG